MDKFRIVTNGEVALGYNPEEVSKKLTQLCKYDQETLDQLFSSLPFIFKTGLDAATASRYKTVLDQTGIVCRIEKAVPERKIELDSHGSFAISHHPRSIQDQQMICPKCGEQQVKRMTCCACHIVIEKYTRQQQAGPQAVAADQTQPVVAEKGTRSGLLIWLVVVALLGLGLYFALKFLPA